MELGDIDASTADAILRIGDDFLELEGSCMMDIDLLESGSEKAESRHVRFGEMHVREYSQVLGDHPCCQEGPPISLGWDYSQEQTCSVDDYEAKRLQCRRTRHELRLSFTDRREILSDVSDDEVKRGCRRLHRERRCSGKAMQSFFGATLHIAVTE
jgi:hypothetical protein